MLAGCPSDDDATCGPDGAPSAGIVAGDVDVTITYGNLEAGINNDCPDADAPEGVVSVSIHGVQTDGTGLITLCISRPDLIATGEQALGPDIPGSAVHVVDVTGTFDGCSYELDQNRIPTGKATTRGMCGVNGADPAGFALTLDGAVGLVKTCPAMSPVTVQVLLTGRAAVAAPPS
ncbi:MAG TPA: hypothetical protein VIU61_13830 [Kofleriaceae bacterium]